MVPDTPMCSDDETVKSQEKFQTCTHSITTSVNDKIQSLNSVKSISSLLCQALSSISSDCVEHLENCLDTEDVIIMSENHIEQLKVFFINLATDKVSSELDLNNCQEQLEDPEESEKETRNTVEEDNTEFMMEHRESSNSNFEQNNKSEEQGKVAIATLSEMKEEKEPAGLVSKKKQDIRMASNAFSLNLNSLLLLISFPLFYYTC